MYLTHFPQRKKECADCFYQQTFYIFPSTVSISVWCHISMGRTYHARYGKPYDSHDQFHHGFEHRDRRNWHNGDPEWDGSHSGRGDGSPRHRIHINNAQNRHPIVHRSDYKESKEYWRQHHPASYKYSPGMSLNTYVTFNCFVFYCFSSNNQQVSSSDLI